MNNKQLKYEYGITADNDGICEVCHFEAKVSTYYLKHENLLLKEPHYKVSYCRDICPPCMLEIARYLKSKFKTGE